MAKAAAVGAKLLLKARNLASVAPSAVVAFAAKLKKASKVSVSSVQPRLRSVEEHEIIQQRRRDRKHGKKVATVSLRQANIVAAVVFLKHLTDVVFRRVVKKVDIDASNILKGSANIRIGAIKSKGMSLPSKSMPRRKRSARKSGS